MTDAVLVFPVLGRPGHAAEAYEQAMGAMTDGVSYRVLFVCSHDDRAEIKAVRKAGADLLITLPGRSRWAQKLNDALRATTEPWLFTGADDLCFCPGWADHALEAAARQPNAGVIGTNDLGNPRVLQGIHATHSLVARWYADGYGTVDGPGLVACEEYLHWFSDDELCQTAQARGAFWFARDSWVEHLHPHWRKADDDATYRLGQSAAQRDAALFEERKVLWQRLVRIERRA